MKQSARFVFTQALSELMDSGLSLFQSCSVLCHLNQKDKMVRLAAESVQRKLIQGLSVSDAFLQSEVLSVPRWYGGVLCVCERSGSLHKAFSFLCELEKLLSESRERIYGALLYPVFVVLLAFFGSVFLIVHAPDFFPVSDSQFYSDSFRAMFFALLVFVPSVMLLCFFVSSSFSVDELYLACTVIEFLLSEHMSLSESLEQAVFVCRSGSRLQNLLCNSLQLLKEGYSVESALELLHPSVGMYLHISEQTGNVCNAFSHLKKTVTLAKKRRQTLCLSLLEPGLILITGIYIAILLKQIFLPLLFAWEI